MSKDLTLPRLGETMEEGIVVAWLVAPGQAFKRGEALVEVETDKTVVEVPALEDGTLAEILVPEGETVAVGAVIGRLEGEGEAPSPAAEAPPPQPDAAPSQAPEAGPPPAAATAGPRATPRARKLARAAGLALSEVAGTGRRGRIEARDVAAGAPETAQQAGGLACHLSGPQTGAPVVLLHGFAGDHSVWAGIASGLARAGRRVLAVDLPGHGATEAGAATPEDLAPGLNALIADRLGGPAHLVAHSLGAVPAMSLAEAGHARSLTLIAPVGLGHHIDGDFVTGLARATSAGEVAHLLDRLTAGPNPLSAQAIAEIAAELGKGRLASLADSLLGGTGQAINLRARLAVLAQTLPVRILAPHRDRILDWQEALTVSPRIAVHHLPQAGHMASWDAPREVLEILAAATVP